MFAKTENAVQILDHTTRPLYVVDESGQIAYCNAALADWVGLPVEDVIARLVEYHSQPERSEAMSSSGEPLFGLCPPPSSFSGQEVQGVVTAVGQDGRLKHRRGKFLGLTKPKEGSRDEHTTEELSDSATNRCGVLAILDLEDLSAAALTEFRDQSTDHLHLIIRHFQSEQIHRYSLEALLGDSPAIGKIRSQVKAASQCEANVLILEQAGSLGLRVARTIHYLQSSQSTSSTLDGRTLTTQGLRRALETVQRAPEADSSTLIVSHLSALDKEVASQMIDYVAAAKTLVRVIGIWTSADGTEETENNEGLEAEYRNEPPNAGALTDFFSWLSTMKIDLPRLRDRNEDLPLLTQYFVEGCNQGNVKQVERVSPDALDCIALYSWPGELVELREAIKDAHVACHGVEISARDLPAAVYHARQNAALSANSFEKINLDDLLAEIEQELIERALKRARGNKAEAARMLGLTRPRLYRRLETLGLVGDDERAE